MSRLSLVIFDCDGVLVDSEPIAARIFAEALGELGLQLSHEQMFDYFVGYSLRQCIDVVESLLGHAVPPGFATKLQDRTFAAFEAELRAVDGIEAALDVLPLPHCVASSGSHEKMRKTLGLTGLLARFEGKLFSATQVPRGKPAPDLYLLAASQLGTPPEECVVVEDSPTGVKAGVAAG
ncbi:MAG TPA: HAD family hydrolase, partial [Polyangiaceae bacterium]|nr:HAD family hydrolase [Polyangiaceae bacterium]